MSSRVGAALAVLLLGVLVQATNQAPEFKHRNLYKEVSVFAKKHPANSRIVGGREAKPHSHPHQAALFIHTSIGKFICGGSLISRKYVLTAAHCLDEKVEVVLGAHNVHDSAEASQLRLTSTGHVQHQDWNQAEFLNDVAVVELPYKVTPNKHIAVAALPRLSQINETFEGEAAVVTGWGKTSDDIAGVTEVLREANVTVMGNAECRKVFDNVREQHVCTSGVGVKGTCMGDSGGPLVHRGVQVGVVAFGSIYCELGLPSGFSRLTSFLDWIGRHTDVQIQK